VGLNPLTHVHRAAEKLLEGASQVLEGAEKRESPPIGLHINEKVDVALRAALAARHGAKDPDVRGPVSCGDAEDLLTPRSQIL
jgi:hypothetical protein